MLNDNHVVSFVMRITQQDSYMKHEGILESVMKYSMNGNLYLLSNRFYAISHEK